MSELLSGVRVLESAMLFNGDTVGAHLGDLGADVIKVEGPPLGDYLRHFLGQIGPGNSPAHVQINRNSAASRSTCEARKGARSSGACRRRRTCSSTATPRRRTGNSGGGAQVDFGAGQEGLRHELQEIFSQRSLAEWVEFASEHDIAMGPAYRSIVEAADDPQYLARGSLYTAVHPTAGEYTYVREVGNVAGQPYRMSRHAPAYGQHTIEVLSELGYPRARIDELVASKVVSTA